MNKEAFEMESGTFRIPACYNGTYYTHTFTHSGVVGSEDSTTFKPNLVDEKQEEGFVNPLYA